MQRPSCSDGILNQEETGIDCGGPHCPACGSCSDAIQNQGETGIDCGGAFCGACPSCSDGVQNQGETGVDCGGPSCSACGINTAPLAQMTVTPAVGSYDGAPATLFQGNAGASSDREDASAALSYSWDWDNDGLSDAAGVTSTHTYSAPGVYDARLTVQDTGGLKATTTFRVVVSSTSNIVLVTTASDENTVGASPASPGGSGLSLREAINYANVTAGRQSILVPAGFTIALRGSLPDVTDTLGMDIVGDGAIWDGSGTGQNEDCLTVVSPNCRIFGFEIQNCNRSPLRLDAGSTGSQVSRLKVHDNDQQVVLNDSNLRFGPYNELSRSAGYCLSIVGPGATVDYNYIHDCPARGIDVTGNSDGSLLLGNAITRCAPGILSAAAADNNVFAHNVIHANSNDGINAGLTSSGLVFRNNVFSNNIGYGLRAGAGVAAVNDHNDYFGNTAGNCTACPSLGAGSLTSDPRYMDSTLDDFRLQPSSANINAGIDTGNDVNGPAPGDGLFNGAAPDIGAREAP